MGINITATYLGLSLGPVIGGLLTQYLGWRSIFAFLVPFGIISLILIRRRIKTEWAEAVGEKFDWSGSAIYGIALASFHVWLFTGFLPHLGWICIATGNYYGSSLFVIREQDKQSCI